MSGPDLLARVQAALAGRYQVEREAGRGGMATVFLARDVVLGRRVAVKILAPEIAAALGAGRFTQEIAFAAQLSHPNILPVHDCGEADGLRYYVMPFAEGGTLRERIDREGTLPIGDVVTVIREIAAGLAQAHGHDVIHRDIKPHNILLTEGRAVLSDFGIARSVGAADREQLTATGVTVGTPTYMSPEQLAGSRTIDGRADQYSLAVVAYEMLAGSAPFTGRDSRAVAARQMFDEVPRLRTLRKVPLGLERAILKALEKDPADRWPTVLAFADALAAGAVADVSEPVSVPAPGTGRRLVRILIGAAAVGAVALAGWALLPTGASTGTSPRRLAVMPFPVEGAAPGIPSDRQIAGQLATRLSGVGLLSVANADTVFEAFRRSAGGGTASLAQQIEVARRVGAGRMVVGRLAVTGSTATMDAAIISVPSGVELARVERAPGRSTAIGQLVDEVAIELLARSFDEPIRRLPLLKLPVPEAAKAYLSGLAWLRRGQYRRSIADLQRATALDSTFALAQLALSTTAQLADREDLRDVPAARAYQNRERLPGPERRMLEVMFGTEVYWRPVLAGWTRLVDSLPGEWEPAVHLAVRLMEWGPAIGVTDARSQAANLFRQTLTTDSAFAPSLERLIDLAVARGDTSEVQRLGSRYLTADAGADRASLVRWQIGLGLGRPMAADSVAALWADLSPAALIRVIGTAQLQGAGLEDAGMAALEVRRRAKTPGDAWLAALTSRQLALNRGRPGDLLPAAPNLGSRSYEPLFSVVEALFWGGDSTNAAMLVGERAPEVDRLPMVARPATDPALMAICAIGLWRAALGNGDPVGAIERLRLVQGVEERAYTTYVTLCLRTLELLSSQRGAAATARAATELDSLLALRPATNAYIILGATLTLAKARERAGDLRGALAVVRRRSYSPAATFGTTGLSTLLREEGRLAALAGDAHGAFDAYSHYLELRRGATGRAATEAAEVRREMARLLPDGP